MRTRTRTNLAVVVVLAGGCAVLTWQSARAEDAPRHQVPTSKEGNVVIGLCDGQTSLEVKGTKDPSTITRAQARELAQRLMAEWRRKNPNARWDVVPASGTQLAQVQSPPVVRPGGDTASSGARGVARTADAGIQSGHTYGAFSARDEAIWNASVDQVIAQGKRIFHSADELGSTVATSCDMCHPDAANTHPETYPKYQVQLGRVVLLRDMINWCIENPVRGRPLADGDPKMKALEAYILSQRKGVPLDYGKH